MLQTSNPTATPLVNPTIEQAKQVNLAPAKPAYQAPKQGNPDQPQQHYLGDLEDGEDTSQDAADLVSSHDEVKIETAVQEVIPKYQLIQQVNPQNQRIQPKSPEKQREVPASATPQNPEMPKIKTEEKLPAKVEVKTTATAALVTVAEPVKPRSKLALPKAVSKPTAEPKTAEKKPVAVIETKPVKPVANPPQISKLISKPKMEEDENFMIESDNVDENLYSSETTDSSDSTSDSSSNSDAKKAAASKPENIQPKPKLRFSSSSSLEEKKAPIKPANLIQDKPANPVAKPVQAPLNLHSDSDSPEMEQKQVSGAARPANLVFTIPQAAEDLDISGPENELDDDDFWN